MDRITIDAVTKYFGKLLVLDRVSLSVAPHEVVCLIGASGSGKSTLLRMINRLVEPDYGSIFLDNLPIDSSEWGKTGLHKEIGIVFQAYNLFPHMTVLSNVTLALRRVHRMNRAEAEDRAMQTLTLLGMAGHARAYPEQLSGGQQQRVAIARALVTEPRVLLLDEITAALDPELVGEIMRIITDLKSQGMTMVIVTHEMGFARGVADRVCFLDQGRIAEIGPAEQVLRNPQNPRTAQFLQRILEAGRM